MKLENHVRNAFGKCDTPENTVRTIAEGFKKIGYDVGYAPCRVSDDIHWGQIWISALNLKCFGKGLTPALARASAYAELAERFSAGMFFQEFEERVRFNIPAIYGTEARRFLNYQWMDGYVRGRQEEIAGKRLDIEQILQNETHLTPADMASLKNSRMASHWVDGYSVVNDETLKVPINFIAYVHASNGMAAGNTIEEAMLQACCEIFERHAQIQIIRPEKTVPTIDPATVTNPRLLAMLSFYREKKVDVVLKDCSLDGLLPCVGALFINHNLRPGRLEHKILIPGAAFDTDEALSRCFTEAMQGRETLLAASPQFDRPVVHRSRADNLYLLMKCCISPKDISFLEQGETVAYPAGRCGDIFQEIDAVKHICRTLQTDCIVLNLTHPVLNFPVVRVVIPGISDFLPFVSRDILLSADTRPDATWRGQRFKHAMATFFKDSP